MIIFGNKNYKELCECLSIIGVRIFAVKYWILPIYKVVDIK